jgi:hypothetical protein
LFVLRVGQITEMRASLILSGIAQPNRKQRNRQIDTEGSLYVSG